METYIWCAVGGILGWLSGGVSGDRARILRIEEVGTGIFGAFIGGDFLRAMIWGAAEQAKAGFTLGALLLAIGGAVAALALLALMRRAVGPLRSGKKRRH